MDDSKIVRMYLERDEQALHLTSEKYGSRLRALAMGIVNDMSTAEECENDTYFQAWNSIPPHKPENFLYAFLARITRNIAIDCCRSRNRLKRRAFVCQLSDEMEQCIPAPDDTPCRLEAAELAGAINSFLGTLSQRKRDVFLRRYWFMDSIEAVAGRFGMSQSGVKTMLLRIRVGLREYLEKEGYTL